MNVGEIVFGPLSVRERFRDGWDRVFGPKTALNQTFVVTTKTLPMERPEDQCCTK